MHQEVLLDAAFVLYQQAVDKFQGFHVWF